MLSLYPTPKYINPKCPHCQGSGYTANQEKKKVPCQCVVSAYASEYLGPIYRGAQINVKLADKLIQKKNILFFCPDANRYKIAVKSYLLLNGMQYSHETLALDDLITLYLHKADDPTWQNLPKKPDVLIINLNNTHRGGSQNSPHETISASLLDNRCINGLRNFLWFRNQKDYEGFKNTYPNFTNVVRDHFSTFGIS